MHVIERTDAFTLIGADARRGKLTLFAAEGPRDARRAEARRAARRSPRGRRALVRPRGGRAHRRRRGPTDLDYDLDHVALFSAHPEAARGRVCLARIRSRAVGPSGFPRVEVGGAWVEFHPGEPGNPERPLLNHIAVLVDSADKHIAEANDLGVEIDNVVDAPNTYAVFLRGPENVRIEYVEHKPTFSLR